MSSRKQYPFNLIEPKWQQFWEEQQSFRAFNPNEVLPHGHPFAQRHGLEGKKVSAADLPPKFYVLDMFPYPSGAGLHVGHPEGYTATDILARYRRARGFNVLHPMGWDSFGLPAEQYAVKTGQHPRVTTEANIANFTRQIKSLGFSYDWSREIATTDPKYFRWTQWIFLKLYNSWFNPETNKAEPIETLKYPAELEQRAASVPLANPGQRDAGGTLEDRRRAYRDSKRLAFSSEAPVNWCPELGTVLANEEVIDGKSEVGGFPVVRRPMRQWMLRITAYAEKLLADLDTIDWSDSLKEMQRNWIGKSEGAEVSFKVISESVISNQSGAQPASTDSLNTDLLITVFTTRPDTLFGATYMVLSPEHKLVGDITTPEQLEAVKQYQQFAAGKSDLERTELAKEKTGVFTGAYAINPVNGEQIPIWIADYVLASYGTGAIMAVPAHDTRDFEFARKFGLKIKVVVRPMRSDSFMLRLPSDKPGTFEVEHEEQLIKRYLEQPELFYGTVLPFVYEGSAVNSDFINECGVDDAKATITAWLESKGLGKKTINYKLRDWLFSRQRYWGEPFPIVWNSDANGNAYHEALPESALPLLPPALDDYKPTPDGQPPLARAQDWVNLPAGSVRETNTMPQWAGSCWYYLRYLDAGNEAAFVSSEAERYWMGTASASPFKVQSSEFKVQSSASEEKTLNLEPRTLNSEQRAPTPGVDLYVGGTEHAVLHLLYARFWHKVLFDLGHVSTPEPFFKLVNQGLILGEMEYYAFHESPIPNGEWVGAEEVTDITEIAQSLVGKHKFTGKELVATKVKDESKIEKMGPWFFMHTNGNKPLVRLETRCSKMSKSRGNVINPDDILVEYGADAFRLYEMFMGPLEMVKPWNTKGVEGVYRFLGRVWRLFVDEASETEFEQAQTTTAPAQQRELLKLIKLHTGIKHAEATKEQLKLLHACIKKVTEDLDGLRFNTAISAMMIFANEAMNWETKPVSVLRDFLILLQPFAPHFAEELWEKLSKAQSPKSKVTDGSAASLDLGPWTLDLSYQPWPQHDPALLVEDTLEIPVQVNGKLRDLIRVAATATPAEIESLALASEKVQQFMVGKTVKKIIVVPKKLVNIVVA